jgi:hypothetical protein
MSATAVVTRPRAAASLRNVRAPVLVVDVVRALRGLPGGVLVLGL